jgi:hypothetical protein
MTASILAISLGLTHRLSVTQHKRGSGTDALGFAGHWLDLQKTGTLSA